MRASWALLAGAAWIAAPGRPVHATPAPNIATLAIPESSVAAAGFPSDVPDRFQILAGGTSAIVGTGAALGRKSGAVSGMVVFEDFFNIPVHKQFGRLDGTWKFGGRHYLDAGYVNIDRTGAREIDSDFSFGDYTFHSGARVQGRLASRFLYMAYRYDFLHEDRVRISGSAGISAERIAAGVTAKSGVTDSNGQAVNGEVSQEAKFTLPVPLVGFQLDWALHPRIAFQAYSRMFSLNYAGIRGNQIDSALRIFWYPWRNLGFGAGYDKVAIGMPQYSTGSETARFAYNIEGLSLYLRGAF